MRINTLIVGAGLAGSTLAEQLASRGNRQVCLIDKRDHIGGNTYDTYNTDGILVQKYGPHIFHTQSQRAWDYLNQFTKWNHYTHRVLACVDGKMVYLPVNLETMEKLYERTFSVDEFKEFLGSQKIKLTSIQNSRDVIVSQIGEALYELFFKNYTKKQWGLYPEELDAQVTGRLPVRFNRDTRYFTDLYQGIPESGYTEMFKKMTDHPHVTIILNTDYREIVSRKKYQEIIFTGPIDEYFDYCYGALPYRSLDFKFATLPIEKFQNAAVVNYPNDYNYTRITEFKHFYFQPHSHTTICYEYPQSKGDPYYPIPKFEYQELYLKYKEKGTSLINTYFVGRLAEYRYYNMDQVVLAALEKADSILSKKGVLSSEND
jgi:UDP-galactopyranose mutase